MTREPPSLRQQIEAVEWAEAHAQAMAEAANMMEAEIDELLRRLSAAVEQLKSWEFAREVLR
jgi:hypothetical protein